MKLQFFTFVLFALAIHAQSQDTRCGTVFNDGFDQDGALPEAWSEYNTSGQVTVEGGRLKFDFTPEHPSAYRTFEAVSKDFAYSFDVESTRNWVTAKMHLISSSGKYLASIVFGNDGVKNIQYATALDDTHKPGTYTGGLIDGSYNKDVSYSLGLTADFEHQTIALYFDGILKVSDIPFLEQATDFARIEIEQLAMYSGEGRFYFDNILLQSEDVNRAELAAALTAAMHAVDAAIIGTGYGNYPLSAYTDLENAINEVNPVLTNCSASQEEIDQAQQTIESAFAVFNASRISPLVLTLYSGYNFTGETKEFECGYYNGNLGSYDDTAISFKLDSGYMVTFARDVNGLGASKVYIAQGEDLSINLPADLQGAVSFIRVGPWFNADKKGGCGKGVDIMDALGVTWYYNWGLTSGESTSTREFIPMSWGGIPAISKMQEVGQNMTFTHHLAFNEPDGPDQANMTVEKALEGYKNMHASGLRLGAPAVTHENRGTLWLDEFMDSCRTRGYRVDFIPAHHYVRRTTQGLYDYLKKIYDKHHLPIWLTEYNYGNANYSAIISDEIALAKLQGYNTMLDTCNFIERYSAFYFGVDKGQLSFYTQRTPLVLNSIGEYYAAHETELSYTQESYEQGPYVETAIHAPVLNPLGVGFYPNPVTGNVIHMVYSDVASVDDAEVSVYDISGNRLLFHSNSPEQINVQQLNNGFYLLGIKTELAERIHKIIIRK